MPAPSKPSAHACGGAPPRCCAGPATARATPTTGAYRLFQRRRTQYRPGLGREWGRPALDIAVGQNHDCAYLVSAASAWAEARSPTTWIEFTIQKPSLGHLACPAQITEERQHRRLGRVGLVRQGPIDVPSLSAQRELGIELVVSA